MASVAATPPVDKVDNLTEYTARTEDTRGKPGKKTKTTTEVGTVKTTTVSIHAFNAGPKDPPLGELKNAPLSPLGSSKTFTPLTALNEEVTFEGLDEAGKRRYLQDHQAALDQTTQKIFQDFLELKLSDLAGFKTRFELHDNMYKSSLDNAKSQEFQTTFWDLRTKDTANYGPVKNDLNECKAIFEERIAQLNKAIGEYEFQSLFLEYIKGCDGLINSWWQGSKGYRFGSAYRMSQIETDLATKKAALGIKPEELTNIGSGSASNSNPEGELAVVDQLFQLDCELVILKEKVTIFNEFLKKISTETLKETNYAQLFYDEHKRDLENIKAGFAALKQKAIPERLKLLEEQIAVKSSNTKSEEYQALDLEKAKFPILNDVEIDKRIAEVEGFLSTRKTFFKLVDNKPDTDEKTSSEKSAKKEKVEEITPTIIFDSQNADLAFVGRIVGLKERIKLSSKWDAKLTPEQRKAEFFSFVKEEQALKDEVALQEKRRNQIATAANIYKSYITALTEGKKMIEDNLKVLVQLNAARSSWQVNKAVENSQTSSTTTTTTTTGISSSSTAAPVAAAAKK